MQTEGSSESSGSLSMGGRRRIAAAVGISSCPTSAMAPAFSDRTSSRGSSMELEPFKTCPDVKAGRISLLALHPMAQAAATATIRTPSPTPLRIVRPPKTIRPYRRDRRLLSAFREKAAEAAGRAEAVGSSLTRTSHPAQLAGHAISNSGGYCVSSVGFARGNCSSCSIPAISAPAVQRASWAER